ncbi:uncharacterized protein SPPG_03740 [Spizellomyces punctatus DAOM BR117]|uniref:Mid2 domain-containing protein n=1 Tax=Spizellomyces punctatus (strain DAOM BR117) TaxID=645134 RepID=A0A0L0HHQ8_SPIPD|nr:uncharacterized protein SPPG_03740 [Spizellomyces punctatus DAOM BR117]KND00613.1 hypothetical protein SPPG_03740 [Spizellomyces punctatus DAOM BR117]|eukprot:XP_016608652.1 hypothetical protein SPPG_03740 [Spizellomyces punctatus DAOM BR117]
MSLRLRQRAAIGMARRMALLAWVALVLSVGSVHVRADPQLGNIFTDIFGGGRGASSSTTTATISSPATIPSVSSTTDPIPSSIVTSAIQTSVPSVSVPISSATPVTSLPPVTQIITRSRATPTLAVTDTATSVATATAGAQTAETKSSSTTKISLLSIGIVGGAIGAAVLGIYVFRKATLAPSGDFRKRMMTREYGNTLSSNASSRPINSTSAGGSGEKDPRSNFLMELNHTNGRGPSPVPTAYAATEYGARSDYGGQYTMPATYATYQSHAAPSEYGGYAAYPGPAAYPPPPGSDYGGSNSGYQPPRHYGY